ncbi:MAG: helix-turn-helix transcriptional regulator [Undibacterium umbellatum]|uniref:helix-turn-helix domain-containing protein n=1 Tax=Undibacterium umbellatum TaxID=2762300 RepID=UPI003BB60B76
METILGLELKRKRTCANLSLKNLAEFVGCTAPYLHKIEHGRTAPTNHIFLEKLAGALMLPESEHAQFIEFAYESQRTIRLHKDASADSVRIINRIAKFLPKLNNEDLQMLEIILWNAEKKMEGNKMSIS